MDDANNSSIAWQRARNGMVYLPAPDSLWLHAPAPIQARYNVLGVPLEFSTNAPALASLAEEVFGDWGPPDPQAEMESARLAVYLHDVCDTVGAEESPAALMRAQKRYFVVSRGNSLGFGDRAAGFATAFVTPELAANRPLIQVCFLECLGMFVVCRDRPITLHAAAVVHRGRCVLLTGEPGAGKSTLAYACLRAGFQLLAEDIVFAAEPTEPLAIWGNPWYLHLLPDAARFFPELRSVPSVEQLNGERKLRLKVNAVRPEAAVPHHSVWGVCSLGRASGCEARLHSGNADSIRGALTSFQGDPLLNRMAIEAAAEKLGAGRIAHLEVGSDLEAAVAALRGWIEAE